jgi:hypothetical protein
MRRTESKVIGGKRFDVSQMPGRLSQRVFWRLSGVLVPVLAEAGKGLKVPLTDILQGGMKSLLSLDLDLGGVLGNLGSAAQTFYRALPEAQLEQLTNELLETATVQMNGAVSPVLPVYDEIFAGDVKSAFELLWFAMKVNWGNFLPDLAGQATLAAMSSSSGVSTTSKPSGPAGV